MLICFFDSQGGVLKEFVPQGQTVNQQYYREVLEWRRKRVHVQPEIVYTWMLHYDAASHCHLHEQIFDLKRYSSGSAAPLLTWSESVWLIPFPETQIPPLRSSFWNCEQHPKGCDRPANGISTWRLPALLPGMGATSPAVCGFQRELLWKGWWFVVQLLIKNFTAPVSLLFRHTSYEKVIS